MRILRRPAEPYSSPGTPDAPPGAPIGQAPEYWIDPAFSIDEQLPPMGSLLDWLLPDEPTCSQQY
jgi:hypothetical protein